jgi:hypothetical protein
MRKTVLMLVALGCLAFTATASAQGITVSDPTPTKTFSGTYHCGYEWKWNATTQEWEQDKSKPYYCEQQGYVYAGTDGVVACSGNEKITRPDDGSAVQGYVWIGPDHAATTPTGQAPGGLFGAGNNNEGPDGPTGEGPCTQGNTSPPAKPTEPPAGQ